MKKFAGILAAAAAASVMSLSAGAQGIINDVIDGAENVVDDTADAAEDIIGGGSGNGGNDNTIGDSGNGGGNMNGDGDIVDDTQDDDIPDQIEDDTDSAESGNNPTAGKDENTQIPESTEEDPNPSTGVPFMTAGLVALSAAGVAYLSRRKFNGDDL